MINIKIFEDQTGFQLFPEKSHDKNDTIVKFFDNKIDLYISKGDVGEDLLIINCYVLIYKGQERPIGCYIVGSSVYTDNIFTTFKNDANDALNKIGFKPHRDQDENTIFEGLEKFDYISSKIEIDEILQALLSGDKLSFNAGNILDIAAFSRQLMKNTKKIQIAISTGKTRLGDINILRNKIYQDRLSPTNETNDIFNRRKNNIRRKLEDEKRKLEDENKRMLEEDKKGKGDIGNKKIDEGTKLISYGLTTKRNAGYDTTEDIKRIYTEISGKPLPEKSKGIGICTIILLSIALLMFGIIIGGFAMQHWLNIKNDIVNVNNDIAIIPTPISKEMITGESSRVLQVDDIKNNTINESTNNNASSANITANGTS